METYLLKNQFTSSLMGLPGIYVSPYSPEYGRVDVFDVQNPCHLGIGKPIVSLPKSVNTQLVHAFLKQLQHNNARLEGIESLRKYLQCAEKKDKNTEINADIKNDFKDIFFGLLLVVGNAGGYLLTMLLMGLFPVYASWLSFLLIPIVILGIYGGINSLAGIAKLGYRLISGCFRKSNVELLPLLEQKLKLDVLQSDLPSYEEIQKNYYQPTSVAYQNELPPPTYQQATELLSTQSATSPMYVQVAMPGTTANFFQVRQNASNHREPSESPLARCRNF